MVFLWYLYQVIIQIVAFVKGHEKVKSYFLVLYIMTLLFNLCSLFQKIEVNTYHLNYVKKLFSRLVWK